MSRKNINQQSSGSQLAPVQLDTRCQSPLACLVALILAGTLTACSDEEASGPSLSAGGTPADAGGIDESGGAATGGTPGLGAFTGRQLFDFDFVDDGSTAGWSTTAATASGAPCLNASSGGTLELIDEDRDPDNDTPGALRFSAAFPAYDQFGVGCDVQALFTYGDAATGTNTMLNGGTMLRFWLRLSSPPPASGLDFAQPFIQGGVASSFGSNFGFIDPYDPVANPSSVEFINDGWREYVLDLSTAYDVPIGVTPYPADVWRIGVSLRPVGEGTLPPAPGQGLDAGVDLGADAGPHDGTETPVEGRTPPGLVIDIDDISIE